MTDKLRICRTQGCLVAFDPKHRVRFADEPPEMANTCPRCGADLNKNQFIRRASDEASEEE